MQCFSWKVALFIWKALHFSWNAVLFIWNAALFIWNALCFSWKVPHFMKSGAFHEKHCAFHMKSTWSFLWILFTWMNPYESLYESFLWKGPALFVKSGTFHETKDHLQGSVTLCFTTWLSDALFNSVFQPTVVAILSQQT